MTKEKKDAPARQSKSASDNKTTNNVPQESVESNHYASDTATDIDATTVATINANAHVSGYATKTQAIYSTINDVLDDIILNKITNPYDIEKNMLVAIGLTFELENALRSKHDQWKIPQVLGGIEIALIINRLYPVVSIATDFTSNRELDVLAIYKDTGENKGLYVTDEHEFRTLARQYNSSIKNREINEVLLVLKDLAPRKCCCKQKNLIAVNNGIYNFDTKQLMPFDQQFVFTSKSRVDYNPFAQNQLIYNSDDGTTWDVESWMTDLSDDPEIVELLWQVIGACIRPLVSWNKGIWFYSNTGNNGKGTLCHLMRNLLGNGTHTSISLGDFSKEFTLEPLMHVSAIIVDENDVGAYSDKNANLKAVITGDVIQINRKFKAPIAFRYQGIMVQCVNEMPKVKDKSDSFLRRVLLVPFTKCFTGQERKYIKNDYLNRKEVLEYVLYRVLHMDYYEFNNPSVCQELLNEYKEYNDPIEQFVTDSVEDATWDLLPFGYLYDAYKVWHALNNPSGKAENKSTFIEHLCQVISRNPHWKCEDKKKQYNPKNRMNGNDVNIQRYGLSEWKNGPYASHYRGIVRATRSQATGVGNTPPQGTKG